MEGVENEVTFDQYTLYTRADPESFNGGKCNFKLD